MKDSALFNYLIDTPHPKLNEILEKLYSNDQVMWEKCSISGAFLWANSPEGAFYWARIHDWYRKQ